MNMPRDGRLSIELPSDLPSTVYICVTVAGVADRDGAADVEAFSFTGRMVIPN